MKNVLRPLLAAAALVLMPVATAYAQDQVKEAARDAEREGTIVDGATGAAIAGAIITAGVQTGLTDAKGHYRAPAGTQPLQVSARRFCSIRPSR